VPRYAWSRATSAATRTWSSSGWTGRGGEGCGSRASGSPAWGSLRSRRRRVSGSRWSRSRRFHEGRAAPLGCSPEGFALIAAGRTGGMPARVGTSPVSARAEYSVFDAAKESLFGDPYSDPDRWQPLSLGTLLTEGWDEPWISPPKGGGGAPRQSWLNAFNGV